MRFGIIGFGSIGERHAKNLKFLGQNDIILFREIGKGNKFNFKELHSFKEFLESNLDAIILSNPTGMHFKYLKQILKYNINVIVEKPIVSEINDLEEIKELLPKYTGKGMIALNMRYHPCVIEAKKIISNKKIGDIFSARFFVGQYLPDWRKSKDYSKSYSAKNKMGGGVLLDLIHEIDLACFFFGKPLNPISSIVEKISNLNIDTEDIAEILYKSENNQIVSIHLDYLVRGYRRYIEIIGEEGSIFIDLYRNKINIMEDVDIISTINIDKFDRNIMYCNLIEDFIKTLNSNNNPPITLSEGVISNEIALIVKNKNNEC